MSHIVQKVCEVEDLSLLITAAEKLGLETKLHRRPRYYGTVSGGTESKLCDLVILLPGKYDLGVHRDGETYQWVCDSELLSGSYGLQDLGRRLLGENAENLMTAYGEAKVELELLQLGLNFTRRVVDGRIEYEIDESQLPILESRVG